MLFTLPIGWLTAPLGLLLIGAVMLDVMLTVLHVQAESPISNALNRKLWTILLQLTRPLPPPARDIILGWGAPLMIVGILVLWGGLFVVGFALLYTPVIHDPRAFTFSDATPSRPLSDALYFSAISFFTTGYGDITPLHPLARLLAVLQAALGLTTLSLSVTYLLSVYPLIARKASEAEGLNQETGGRADAVILAERYLKGGHQEALAQRLATTNHELLRLGQAHGLYPVLYYVRHREVHRSFVRILVIVQGIVATLRYSLDPEHYPEVVHDPRLALLEEGLLSTLHTLAASSHLAPQRLSPEVIEQAGADFHHLLAQLREHDIATISPDDNEAARRHQRFRTATDQYIRAYAANSGYEMADVHAIYSRWDRDTALVGHAELEFLEDAAPPASAAPSTPGQPSGHDTPEPRQAPANGAIGRTAETPAQR